MPERTATLFNEHRGWLFAIAYRMLGSATDAEDIVQEAFVRWMEAGDAEVQSPKAYLSAIVVRLAIDHLRAARSRREQYVGPWLPEPVEAGHMPDVADTVALAESLSFAFLVLLESLGPLERAVLLLHDVFDYTYPEIASMVGKSEANCRQILHRARERLQQRRPRFDVPTAQQQRMTEQFLRATTSGDLDGLLGMLADDIVFTADSGGKVRAALKPIQGRDKVSRGALGGMRWLPAGLQTRMATINGQPALVGELNGQPYGVVLLDIAGERIQHIYMLLNPDKLGWLGRA
jgi:RNA polymerase sigma-70 factor (ECF subfamily)